MKEQHRKKQLSLDFIQSFNSKKYGSEELISAIDSLLEVENLSVRVVPFGYTQGADIDWSKAPTGWRREISPLYRSDDLQAYRLCHKRIVSDDQVVTETGTFFIVKNRHLPDVGTAIVVSDSDFFHSGFLPILRKLHPKILTTFISHKKMKALIEDFASANGKLTITRAAQRLRRDDQQPGQRAIPIISWPQMSIIEAMEWVEGQNGWFESLEFEVDAISGYKVKVAITRQGVVKATGLFLEAYRAFVTPISTTIHDNLKMFRDRGRLERDDLSPAPLQIIFDSERFDDVTENRRFIDSMHLMKTASVSVLHGNPYVHLSVLDYEDASAFDIWILDSSRIIIVPQLKASIAGIKRIINHVFDSYGEGRLGNYVEAAL